MKTTVLKSVLKMKATTQYLFVVAIGILASVKSSAQTYTTKADGNWNSATTWVGGIIPSRTIAAGTTVNIKHDVNCNLAGDIAISGTLNVDNDTLRFGISFANKITVNTGGTLNVRNGGFLQDMSEKRNDLIINGRVLFENAKVQISKTVVANAGTKRAYKNATVKVGDVYTITGSSASKVSDTILKSSLEILSGNFDGKQYVNLRVSNAKVTVTTGDFLQDVNSDIITIPGAVSNYGFNLIRVKKDLENKGSWDARIDQHCVSGNIKGSNMAAIDFTRSEDCSVEDQTPTAAAPELVFKNPELKSGTANKEGAVYRFSNVTTGIDAEVKLKKFSRSQIVMESIDLGSMGWEKAFQPQFGLTGLVQPNQNWYIDFEMVFYKTGTNQKQKMAKIDMTALDVDGDGVSIREYAQFENPSNIIYSTVSYLTNQSAGLVGQSFLCPTDGLLSPLLLCLSCGGDGKAGLWNIDECTACEGSGLKYTLCSHGYDGINGSTVQGPVENFLNIDTLATQVMATYQYVDRDRIQFRYGAKSGSQSSNGAGVRLNSLWFRQFSMQSAVTLPVKISNFTATYDKKNANLSWTGYEENFSHYVLQRSADGKEYSDVALIFATGNGEANYKYKDANVSSATGSVFYRLKLVDKGQEGGKYSDVRVIRLAQQQESLQLTTYPNPVTDQLRVTLPAAWQGKTVMIELFSANGTRVQNMQLGSASQTENVQMSKLSKGFYIVKVTCEGEVAQQRVVKN